MHNIDTTQEQDKYHNHTQVWELLPWYINGSLSAEEKQQISAHTTVCLLCRKELALQSALRDSVKNHELDEVMVAASFERLSAKLHTQDAGRQTPRANAQSTLRKRVGHYANALHLWWQHQFGSGYFVPAMLVLALAAILPAITAEMLIGNNTFKTLSNSIELPVTADVRLIFADGVAESERDAILAGAGLSIVSGPDDRGLYLVDADNVSASALETTVRQLRSNEKILFAEFATSASPNSPQPGEQ